MPITWRTPAAWPDIEPCLESQPRSRGDALVGREAAIKVWKRLYESPFFASTVLESRPATQGHCRVGVGTSVFVSTAFADAEMANPREDINSRIIASIHTGRSVLATRADVARANAGEGVDVIILFGVWCEQILSRAQMHEAQTCLVSSFAEYHAGYNVRRIVEETTNEAKREFLNHSVVVRTVAEFPEAGRVIHAITRESVRNENSSVANALFSVREPLLRLRESDQQLLLAALRGATDPELSVQLNLTLSAIKARWRSTFARVEETLPDLVHEVDEHDGRGMQKRHRILAYVRSHPEELRPYAWASSVSQPISLAAGHE